MKATSLLAAAVLPVGLMADVWHLHVRQVGRVHQHQWECELASDDLAEFGPSAALRRLIKYLPNTFP